MYSSNLIVQYSTVQWIGIDFAETRAKYDFLFVTETTEVRKKTDIRQKFNMIN